MVDGASDDSGQKNDDGAEDATTLVTFLLNDLRKANRIELLGSWDNFSTPYPMTRDSRRGRGYWRGIHTFKNIICDGDLSQDIHSSQRDGALLAGGLYWYFYRIDGDIEYYNPAEPSTNNCPLLPGQTVNVLEVPVEEPARASLDTPDVEPSSAMTWNPDDRWAPLKRKRDPAAAANQRNNSFKISRHKPHLEKMRRMYTSSGGSSSTGSSHKVRSSSINRQESAGSSCARPRSCPEALSCNDVNDTASRPYSRRASSSHRDINITSSQDLRSTSRSSVSKINDTMNLFHGESHGGPTATARVAEFLAISRHLPSRARTASATYRSHTSFWERSQNRLRPSSAPSAFACPQPPDEVLELDDSEKLGKRMRSLRLRIACAKLRKLQTEHETSDNLDTSWILNSLPNTFSEVLQNFVARDGADPPRRERASVNFDEMSASPPQLSYSSRQSTLWTPETASVLGTAEDSFGPSIRMAMRQSGDFQLAVQNALDLTDSPPQQTNKAVDRLGVRFSSIGLDSQETIRPPGAQDKPVRPLDPAWNPFCSDNDSEESHEGKGKESDNKKENEEAAEQQSNTGFLPHPTEGLNANGLMDDLGFLGKAIA